MKKIFKKIGRFFIALNEVCENDLRQTVLLLDGSFILPNNLALIIKGVKQKFKNAKFILLTFEEKKEFIKDNFPDIEIITPLERFKQSKHKLVIQLLLLLLRKRFSVIVLSSLDISLLFISVIFGRCSFFLHNRWMEWYGIRRRTLSDILKRTQNDDGNRRRKNRGIKEIIKSFGRAFLILSKRDDRHIQAKILIEDNGYTDIGHIINAIRAAEKIFVNPDMTLLTFSARKQDFENNFPGLKIVTVPDSNKRYGLAIEMLRTPKFGYRYIILTSLDISPLLAAFLFIKARILLYNRWHQWWGIKLRNLLGYSKMAFVFLFRVPVYAYLFVTSIFILVVTKLRMRLSD